MGLGTFSPASRILIPRPPQNRTTFISDPPLRAEPPPTLPVCCQMLPAVCLWLRPSQAATSPKLDRNRCQSPLRGLLAALKALVGPHVAPVSVTAAIGDSQVVEV